MVRQIPIVLLYTKCKTLRASTDGTDRAFNREETKPAFIMGWE
jgi:hypothetical protein